MYYVKVIILLKKAVILFCFLIFLVKTDKTLDKDFFKFIIPF